MISYIAGFVGAAAVSAVVTPLVRSAATRDGRLDCPDDGERRVHARSTPRVGGVAVLVATYLPILALIQLRSGVGVTFVEDPLIAYGMLLGGFMLATVGVADDLWGLSAPPKLVVQLAVAAMMVYLGFRIRVPALGLDGVSAGALGGALSVLWLVGVTNAFNLIDGLDGLASGLGLISTTLLAVLATLNGAIFLAIVCWSLAGALFGFLVYNWHPATIFLGDSGSLLIGFLLATASSQASHKLPLLVALAVPLLATGLPIIDTLLAIARRVRRGENVMRGDADHIHHRLLRSGGHRRAVLLLYGVGLLFAAAALLLVLLRDWSLAPGALLALTASALLARALRSQVSTPGDQN